MCFPNEWGRGTVCGHRDCAARPSTVNDQTAGDGGPCADSMIASAGRRVKRPVAALGRGRRGTKTAPTCRSGSTRRSLSASAEQCIGRSGRDPAPVHFAGNGQQRKRDKQSSHDNAFLSSYFVKRIYYLSVTLSYAYGAYLSIPFTKYFLGSDHVMLPTVGRGRKTPSAGGKNVFRQREAMLRCGKGKSFALRRENHFRHERDIAQVGKSFTDGGKPHFIAWKGKSFIDRGKPISLRGKRNGQQEERAARSRRLPCRPFCRI